MMGLLKFEATLGSLSLSLFNMLCGVARSAFGDRTEAKVPCVSPGPHTLSSSDEIHSSRSAMWAFRRNHTLIIGCTSIADGSLILLQALRALSGICIRPVSSTELKTLENAASSFRGSSSCLPSTHASTIACSTLMTTPSCPQGFAMVGLLFFSER